MVPATRKNQNWMSDFFNDIFDNSWMIRTNTAAPAVNVVEKESGYELELAAPGLTKEDFHLTLNADGNLVIKVEKQTEGSKEENAEKGRILRREWSCSKFRQTMLLPENADREHIAAKVENGVLSVNIPKVVPAKEEEKEHLIEIQ